MSVLTRIAQAWSAALCWLFGHELPWNCPARDGCDGLPCGLPCPRCGRPCRQTQ